MRPEVLKTNPVSPAPVVTLEFCTNIVSNLLVVACTKLSLAINSPPEFLHSPRHSRIYYKTPCNWSSTECIECTRGALIVVFRKLPIHSHIYIQHMQLIEE